MFGVTYWCEKGNFFLNDPITIKNNCFMIYNTSIISTDGGKKGNFLPNDPITMKNRLSGIDSQVYPSKETL